MIAALVAVFVWFALQRSSRRSLLPFVVMVAALLALTTVQSIRGDPTPLARFHHVTETAPGDAGAGSLESRIATYRVAATAIKRDPFLGVGLDLVSVTKPFGVVSYEYDVHNLVIGTWYKAGLFGLIGMLMAVFAVLRVGLDGHPRFAHRQRRGGGRRAPELVRRVRRLRDGRSGALLALRLDPRGAALGVTRSSATRAGAATSGGAAAHGARAPRSAGLPRRIWGASSIWIVWKLQPPLHR